MGVIDLDKRVRKLEQEGTGGAVVDQLEAAVTAIENELTVTVTDISGDLETLPEGVTVSLANLQSYGKIRMLTFVATNSGTKVEASVLYTIPAGIMPYNSLSFITSSIDEIWIEQDSENDNYHVLFAVDAGGEIYATLTWLANPAPTPGE